MYFFKHLWRWQSPLISTERFSGSSEVNLASALLTTVSALLRVRSDKLPCWNHCQANTSLSQQHPFQHKNQRGGDFALQKMIAEKQIILSLRSARSLEVSANQLICEWDKKRQEYTTGESTLKLDLQQPAACAPLNQLTESFLRTSWILSEHYLPKSPKLKDSAVALVDLRYSLHLHLYCRKPLQFQTVINGEN